MKNKILIGGVVIVVICLLALVGFYLKGEQSPAASGELTSSSTPGSCLVLPEEYCASGKLINSPMLGSDAIAFNVPEGTPVFAPYGGKFLATDVRESDTSSRYPLYLTFKNGGYTDIFDAVFIPSPKAGDIATKINDTNISQGTVIGYMSGSNVYLKNYPGENYDLIVSFEKKGVKYTDEWDLDPAIKGLFNL